MSASPYALVGPPPEKWRYTGPETAGTVATPAESHVVYPDGTTNLLPGQTVAVYLDQTGTTHGGTLVNPYAFTYLIVTIKVADGQAANLYITREVYFNLFDLMFSGDQNYAILGRLTGSKRILYYQTV